jgi:glutaredoxin
MKKITLYTMNNCSHCKTAKQYFESNKIPFRLLNVSSPAGQKAFSKTGFRSVPVIKVGDQFMAGFSVVKFNKLLND